MPAEARVAPGVHEHEPDEGGGEQNLDDCEEPEHGGQASRSPRGPRPPDLEPPAVPTCSTWSVVWSSPKRSCEHALELEADPVAVGAGLDEHVRGEGREAVGDRPDVEVVGLDDALVLDDRAADVGRRSRLGGALRGRSARTRAGATMRAANISPATKSEAIGSKRFQPVSQDENARERGADEGGEVGGDVQVRAADVQALPSRARQEREHGEVDRDADDRDDGDDARPRPRAGRPAAGSPRRRSRRRRRASVMPFACAARISARAKPNVQRPRAGERRGPGGEERQAERGGIGEHVAGVGKQGERARRRSRGRPRRP